VTEAEVSIDVSMPCPGWERALPDAERLARDAAQLSLARGISEAAIAPPQHAELGIVLAEDAEQRRLNRDWRGIDRSTNVLAFPSWDPGTPLPAGAPLLLGDVVLAYETAVREAEEHGKPFADHFRHLVVHGVLHLVGYDHSTDAEAVIMESLETAILAELGVADPYRGTM
jgi:probable rRNA maturation factor